MFYQIIVIDIQNHTKNANREGNMLTSTIFKSKQKKSLILKLKYFLWNKTNLYVILVVQNDIIAASSFTPFFEIFFLILIIFAGK